MMFGSTILRMLNCETILYRFIAQALVLLLTVLLSENLVGHFKVECLTQNKLVESTYIGQLAWENNATVNNAGLLLLNAGVVAAQR